jgi:predicted PurR-regulated permease PerM
MKSILSRIASAGMLALVMLAGVGMQSVAVAAPSGMVSTQQLLNETRAQQQRAHVSAFFDRAEVQSLLQARGVEAADAQARVASLTASELASLAVQIDTMPAGEGVLETLVFVLVVFMLLDIAGVTDIFPGI